MKEGIHLGRPLNRGRGARIVVVTLAVATLAHGVWYLWERAETLAQRDELERRAQPVEPSSAPGSSPALSNAMAVLALGAAEREPGTVLLDEIVSRLPPAVTLSTLSWSWGSGSSGSVSDLLLEGIATNAASVSELQRDLDASPIVVSTELLEERRTPSGGIAVRLQLQLQLGRTQTRTQTAGRVAH